MQRNPSQPDTTTASIGSRLLLVSMPFGPLLQPSLALSLLKQVSPIPADVLYLTLSFAKRIGTPLYEWIAEGNPSSTAFVGEWLFSAALFGRSVTAPSSYIDAILRGPQLEGEPIPGNRIEDLLAARDGVEDFLEACTEQILIRRPNIVGFTSVFQQNTASLALAKRLKARSPETSILFGGSNCESVMGMEIAQRFPFLDAVVSGEGENILPQIVERLLNGGTLDGLPGVFTPRTPRAAVPANAPSVHDLNTLPIPDDTDYFRQWEEARLAGSVPPRLLFETSRGCWWGEKQHCTFCGLNGASMTFRRKSADRALRELEELTRRHPGRQVLVVDNILDMKYFNDFIPRLAGRGLELFYEVKANLNKQQLQLLRDAGITMIQPGIESLSDPVLKLMRKGVGSLQNIQLLKWCHEVGVWPLWNFLWGFPGEPPEEYIRMAEEVPLLTHLPPPKFGIPLRLDRFSPNFERAAELGFADVSPVPAYEHIYPFPKQALMKLAYFFTYGYADGRQVEEYTQELQGRIRAWQQQHASSALFYLDKGDELLVCDFRPVAKRSLASVPGVQRALLLACDEVCSLSRLRRVATAGGEIEPDASSLEEILQPLVEQGYLIRRGNSFLSLVLPANSVAAHLHAVSRGSSQEAVPA